jgi:hypothetical protein
LYYGGLEWNTSSWTKVKKFVTDFNPSEKPVAISGEGYSKPGTITPLRTINGDVHFSVLAVDVESSYSAFDLIRNTSSAVIVVTFAGLHFILPGDSTAETVGYINAVLTKWDKAKKGNPIYPCQMLSAPHHGAARTLASNLNAENPDLDVAKAFVRLTQPRCAAASAGYESKHKHPAAKVMSALTSRATDNWIKHTYVAYDFDESDWVDGGPTQLGAFTTILSTKWPIQRQTWNWTVTAAGEVTWVAERNGPPPSEPRPRAVARPIDDLKNRG